MKFKSFLRIAVALAVLLLLLFIVHKIVVQVPGKPGVYKADPKTGQMEPFVMVEGKVEKVRLTESINDFRTQTVVISNDGELILLVGMGKSAKTKIENMSGEVAKINGHWYGKFPFRGKSYRALWVGELDDGNSRDKEVNKENEKKVADDKIENQEQKEKKGGVSEETK